MRRDLEESRGYWRSDMFGHEIGVVIDQVGDGYAKCHLEITGHHLNANGSVMGGAIFTLADMCYGVACNGDSVSMTSEISFLRPAKGGILYAEAQRVKDGRTIVFYRIDVKDDMGREVAFVTMTGFKANA